MNWNKKTTFLERNFILVTLSICSFVGLVVEF